MISATFIAEIALAALLAWLLARRRPQWSRGRVALLAALPIPLVIWGLCLFLIVSASTASAEECGVDACGMVIASAMFMAIANVGLLLLGILVAFLVARQVTQRVEPNLIDVFE